MKLFERNTSIPSGPHFNGALTTFKEHPLMTSGPAKRKRFKGSNVKILAKRARIRRKSEDHGIEVEASSSSISTGFRGDDTSIGSNGQPGLQGTTRCLFENIFEEHLRRKSCHWRSSSRKYSTINTYIVFYPFNFISIIDKLVCKTGYQFTS